MTLRIAAAQCNPTVGDFAGNVARLVAAAHRAVEQDAQVLLTPELALAGYPPEDLLLRDAFYRAGDAALAQLLEASRGFPALDLVVGHACIRDGQRRNAAVHLRDGAVVGEYFKRELPNYDVFDERRYFEPGDAAYVFERHGVKLGVVVCEDFWRHRLAADGSPVTAAGERRRPTPVELSAEAGAQVILALNASPYHLDKQPLRFEAARRSACSRGLPIVTANCVGGQDELVFDGASFALDGAGKLVAQARAFAEDLMLVDVAPTADGELLLSGEVAHLPSVDEQAYSALVLGVRDYVGKNGFPGALIGLSGGVDSALVLAVAVDALGAERVRTVQMPSRYTAGISVTDAADMAQRLGVRHDDVPIAGPFAEFLSLLGPLFEGRGPDTTEENLQARIRGMILMALSNKFGSIVLTTGNKSEMATGYCTLYGDMAGGFAVIKDVLKTKVWALCRWRNAHVPAIAAPGAGGVPAAGEVIPLRIIERPPSAELRENQVDQDSLPPYEVLDAILSAYMEHGRPVDDIVAQGHDGAVVRRVVRLLQVNEYKRRQAPVGIRVTHRAFGRDWRYPITSKFQENPTS